MWQNSHGFQTMPEWSVTLLLLLLLYAYNIHMYIYTDRIFSKIMVCCTQNTFDS